MVMIPNPDKPSEAEEIISIVQELWRLQKNEYWDIVELGKRLSPKLDQICAAAERIDDHYNELYPPTEV